ncbi:MarR family winged helix-turn-helix transcriptional regulator [Tomitella cavernea]|nr:MarR family transcriptional regulator [Tomitella cavernea]
MHTDGDLVDRIVDEWDSAFPDVGLAPVEVIVRIARISTLSLRALEHELARTAVSRGEYEVLGALVRNDHPLRPGEVTTTTMVSPAATTKYVDALVRKGLVERGTWEQDKRVVLLRITDAGRELVRKVFPARVERDRRLLAGLDDDERAVLLGLLRRVTANAEHAAPE